MFDRYRDRYREPERRGSLNGKLKIGLAIWAVAYPVVACGPAWITEGAVIGTIGNAVSFFLASLLFVPWLLGLVVLGALVWVPSPRR